VKEVASKRVGIADRLRTAGQLSAFASGQSTSKGASLMAAVLKAGREGSSPRTPGAASEAEGATPKQ
jgi:hypothetical protein